MMPRIARAIVATAVASVICDRAWAVDTVSFSSSDAGSTHAVDTWADDFGDLRIARDTMGSSLTQVGTDYDMSQPLNADGTLSAAAKAGVDSRAAYIRTNGLSVFLGPTVGNTDASYLNAAYGNVKVDQWAKALTAYKNYWQSLGVAVTGTTPFNEPDYWSGQGSATQNAQLMQLLRDDPGWKGIELQGGTPLSAANAQAWWSPVAGIADAGSTHLLGGNLSQYDAFAQTVVASGKPFAGPELHSLGEAIVTANYNASQAGWWSTVLKARGQFSQSSSGKRLAYSVNFNNQTAGAIYRGPDGATYAFAGGLERTGGGNSFRFVSTDRPMYVNGIGPIKSYTLRAESDVSADVISGTNQQGLFGQYADQGSIAKIDYGAASVPALDGYRWQIQNVLNGQYLNVIGSGTGDSVGINTAVANGSTAQTWDVQQFLDGYLELLNGNSGRAVAVNGATTATGGRILQYQPVRSLDQQWSLVPVGNGAFYIKDGNSGLYLTGSTTNCTQQAMFTGTAAGAQQWRFVSANPTRPAKAKYNFGGNTNDASGNSYHGTVSGTATYVTGPTAGSQALSFNGSNTYVTLPSAVSNTSASSSTAPGLAPNFSSGFSVNTWVKWNGGNAWQRIFDFGTGTNAYMYLTPSSGDGTMRFGITNNGNAYEEDVDTDALTVGQWVNVGLTLGGHSAIIYIDGKPVAAGQVLFNPTFVNATTDYIGKSQFATDPLFNGAISQFSVYDYALTATQMADLLNHNLVWTGSASATWDASAATNFKLVSTGAAIAYSQNDRVTFDGSGPSAVTLSSTLSPFAVTVSSSTDTSFNGAGAIAGSTTLTKTGAGTLTVNNANSFTGGTYISGGTVVMGNAAALGGGAIDVVTGGALTATFSNGTPTITNTIYGDGGSVIAASGSTLTLAGAIAGSGPLTLNTADSSAALRLTGNNSGFAGNAIVSGSDVRLASASAGSAAATWTINSTLRLDAAVAASYQLGALAGAGLIGGDIANASSTASTLVVGGAGADTAFSGQITNNVAGGTNNVVGLTKTGSGTQTLSGTNTYTGPTVVTAGTLTLGNGGTTGSISLASALSVNGGTLGFNHSNALTEGVDFNPINGSGKLLQAGSGVLYLSGTNAYSGGTTITNGTVSISDDLSAGTNGSPISLNGGVLQTTGFVFNTHPITVGTDGGTINVATNGQYFFNINNLLRGYGPLTVTGNGTLTPGVGNLRLNQPNTFSGALVLQQGGILEYGTNGAIGSAGAVWIGNQGELAVQGSSAVSMASSTFVTGSTNAVLSFENGNLGNVTGNIALGMGSTLTVGLRDWFNNGTVHNGTISGLLSGSGALSVNSGNGAAGTLTLSGANTFTGNVTIKSATVAATFNQNAADTNGRAYGSLGNGQIAGRTVTINSGGTLSLAAGNVLGGGGSTIAQAPNLSIVVNSGGTLLTAAPNVGGSGGGDANILGSLALNGGTFTVGNGYNVNYQAAVLLKNVTVGGIAPSTINTNASNLSANGIMLGDSASGTDVITFTVADATGDANADLTVSARLTNSANSAADPSAIGSLAKAGSGTMVLSGNDTYTGATIVQGGTLVAMLAAQGPILSGAGGADIQAGTLTLNYAGGSSPAAAVAAALDAGYDQATKFSSGRFRSTTLPSGRLLGWADNGTAVSIAATLAGDANVDLSVNFADLLALARNYGVASNATWSQGDSNYDGAVNFTDLLALARNYGATLPTADAADFGAAFASDWALAQAIAPEPTLTAALLAGSTGLLSRRRSTKLTAVCSS